jgi:hypothetical protein
MMIRVQYLKCDHTVIIAVISYNFQTIPNFLVADMHKGPTGASKRILIFDAGQNRRNFY